MTEDSILSLIDFSNSYFIFKELEFKHLLSFITECDKLKSKTENKPLYQLNLLDILNTEEPHTSKFLASILNYSENGKFTILESFIDKFLSLAGLDKSSVVNPIITAEKSHVDVRILDNNYAIIIENKLMNAPFQRNQLGRYIKHTKEKGYSDDKIFIVILPQYFNPDLINTIRASAWKCPPDGLRSSNKDRTCAYLDKYKCWCDDNSFIFDSSKIARCEKECIDFRPIYNNRTVVIHSQLSDWLYEIEQIIDSKQIILKSAISQFADFLKGLYDIRINNHLLMDIQKLIKEAMFPEEATALTKWDILNEKAKDLSEIQSAITAMRLQLSKDLIDEWYHELKPEFELLQREVQKSFGININGVWVGCWSGSNNNGSPYWGFYCENKGCKDQQDMVREILEECDIKSDKSSQNFISWDNTRHGAEKCRMFYNAAKKLGRL